MTDRRNRPIIRCAEPSCVSVGPWQASENRCPTHYRELVADLAAAARRARETTPPMTPLDTARALLAANPRKETQ